MKLKGRYFDTSEVTKAESQVVLNILTEHNFHDAFKKTVEVLGTVHTLGKGLLQ
jgi:predicted helicase